MMSQLTEALGQIGLVPVIALDDPEDAVELARALLAGDIGCIEITFRTVAAVGAIQRIAAACPDMLIGAGTIRTVEQAGQAVAAGARFIVAPGFESVVVEWCQARHIPVLPGVVTPTEINLALASNVSLLKFFPAEESGGARMLLALGGPYPEVRFIPTGGINAANLADYLALPNVVACGGSWMATRSMIAAGQFAAITRLSQEARDIVRQVRARSEGGR